MMTFGVNLSSICKAKIEIVHVLNLGTKTNTFGKNVKWMTFMAIFMRRYAKKLWVSTVAETSCSWYLLILTFATSKEIDLPTSKLTAEKLRKNQQSKRAEEYSFFSFSTGKIVCKIDHKR